MFRTLASVVVSLAFWAVCVIVALAVCLPPVKGYHSFALLGHSMTGTINYGSMVLSKPVPVASLKRGDIITMHPSWSKVPVTHRIIKITRQQGKLAFFTKGDHNAKPDPIPQSFEKPIDLYQRHIPYLGYVYWVISRYGFFLCGLPALVLGFVFVRRLWREADAEPKPDFIPELHNVVRPKGFPRS